MSAELFWQQLHTRVEKQIAAIDAVVGFCIHDLSTGLGFEINGSMRFPTASTIKIHILTQLYQEATLGTLDLDQPVDWEPWRTGGSGVLSYLDDAPTLSLRDAANLMIIASDNTATNLCIDTVGIHAVNALLDDLGLEKTRLQRKMMDSQAGRAGQENVATPVELVRMLRLLYRDLPSAAVAQQVLRVLRKPKSGFIDQVVADGIEVANKPGWTSGVRCDAGIVYQSRAPYALAIMLKYGNGTPEALDAAIIGLARTAADAIAILDRSNAFGHGVFA